MTSVFHECRHLIGQPLLVRLIRGVRGKAYENSSDSLRCHSTPFNTHSFGQLQLAFSMSPRMDSLSSLLISNLGVLLVQSFPNLQCLGSIGADVFAMPSLLTMRMSVYESVCRCASISGYRRYGRRGECAAGTDPCAPVLWYVRRSVQVHECAEPSINASGDANECFGR